MAKDRIAISDEALDQVVGGLMHFNYNTQKLKYTSEDDGSVTMYDVVDFKSAWVTANDMHAKNFHEDNIVAKLIEEGWIIPA